MLRLPPNLRPQARYMAVRVELTRDLIEEILLRLPVRSLVRFKCVSKQFIRIRKKTRSSLHPLLVNSAGEFRIGIPSNNGDEDWILFQPVEPKFQVQQAEEYYDLVDHCNGLLCVLLCSNEITNWRPVVVWNPSTTEQKRIRAPDQRYLEKKKEYFGFGYDSTIGDYKVVLVTTFENIPAKIQWLGLKKGSWEIAQNDMRYLFDCNTFSSSYATHVNGYIYWAIKKRGVDGKNGADGIACFDLGRNRMRKEENLSEKLLSGWRYVSLHPLKESLFMIASDDYVNFNAWIMKENGVTGTKSWIKFFDISIEYNVFNPVRYPPIEDDCIIPICVTENGKCLMVAEERQDFFLYDPNEESCKEVKVKFFGSRDRGYWWYPLTPCMESLVSPFHSENKMNARS